MENYVSAVPICSASPGIWYNLQSMDLGSCMIQFDCQTWFLYGSRQFWIGSLDILIPYGKSNEEEATLAPTAVQGRYKRNKPSLCCKMGSKYFWSLIYIFISHNILLMASTNSFQNFESWIFYKICCLLWSGQIIFHHKSKMADGRIFH